MSHFPLMPQPPDFVAEGDTYNDNEQEDLAPKNREQRRLHAGAEALMRKFPQPSGATANGRQIVHALKEFKTRFLLTVPMPDAKDELRQAMEKTVMEHMREALTAMSVMSDASDLERSFGVQLHKRIKFEMDGAKRSWVVLGLILLQAYFWRHCRTAAVDHTKLTREDIIKLFTTTLKLTHDVNDLALSQSQYVQYQGDREVEEWKKKQAEEKNAADAHSEPAAGPTEEDAPKTPSAEAKAAADTHSEPAADPTAEAAPKTPSKATTKPTAKAIAKAEANAKAKAEKKAIDDAAKEKKKSIAEKFKAQMKRIDEEAKAEKKLVDDRRKAEAARISAAAKATKKAQKKPPVNASKPGATRRIEPSAAAAHMPATAPVGDDDDEDDEEVQDLTDVKEYTASATPAAAAAAAAPAAGDPPAVPDDDDEVMFVKQVRAAVDDDAETQTESDNENEHAPSAKATAASDADGDEDEDKDNVEGEGEGEDEGKEAEKEEAKSAQPESAAPSAAAAAAAEVVGDARPHAPSGSDVEMKQALQEFLDSDGGLDDAPAKKKRKVTRIFEEETDESAEPHDGSDDMEQGPPAKKAKKKSGL